MSEEMRPRLIAEIERAIDELLEATDLPAERKALVLRELLAIAVEE